MKMLNSVFRYTRIDEGLLRELAGRVGDRAEGLALLGPRYIGKRYLCDELCRRLKGYGATPITLHLLDQSPIQHEAQFHQRLIAAMKAVGMADTADTADTADSGHAQAPARLLAALEAWYPRRSRPIVLVVTNPDVMARPLAQRFLREALEGAAQKKLVLVLTGEADLLGLLAANEAEATLSGPPLQPFVIQGFSEATFKSFFSRYAYCLEIKVDDLEGVLGRLFRLTGGHTFLTKTVFWHATEALAARVAQEPTGATQLRLRAADLSDDLGFLPASHGTDAVRHTLTLLSRSPGSWEDLRSLRDAGSVPLRGQAGEVPTHLEMAGVAVREAETGLLKLASPLMAKVVRAYYTDRRLGDLHALNGDWGRAFTLYSGVASAARKRPSGLEDSAEAAAIVDAFSSFLFEKAAEDLASVKEFFVRGCSLILGFPTVTFWGQSEGAWRLDEVHGDAPTDACRERLREGLMWSSAATAVEPPAGKARAQQASVGMPGYAAVLRGSGPQEHLAVVVADSGEDGEGASPDRKRLLSRLISSFARAWEHALRVEVNRSRLTFVEGLHGILHDIFGRLGEPGMRSAKECLETAARGLRVRAGYRRVLVTLIEGGEQTPRVFLDEKDAGGLSCDGAGMPHLSLGGPEAEVHQRVISERKPVIVAGARAQPPSASPIAEPGGPQAFAVVPILNRGGAVVGTIHVERAGAAVPSEEEVHSLEQFARHLAVVVEQSERVRLLQAALDNVPEPVVIVDSQQRLRYANGPANALYPTLGTGWQASVPAGEQDGRLPEAVAGYIGAAFGEQNRIMATVSEAGQGDGFGWEVICDRIQDADGVLGGFFHANDQRRLHQLLKAVEMVAQSGSALDAMRAMLRAAGTLGFRSARLYRLDQSSGDCQDAAPLHCAHDLVLIDALHDPARGRPAVPTEATASAAAAEDPDAQPEPPFRIRWGEGPERGWQCLRQDKVCLFCHYEDRGEEEIVRWPSGLWAVNVGRGGWPAGIDRQSGAVWIDVPFGPEDAPLGKLTIDSDASLRMDEFHSLVALKALTQGILANIITRDARARDASRLASGQVVHLLYKPIMTLESRVEDYRDLEPRCPELRPLNDRLESMAREAGELAQRARGLLLLDQPDLKLERFDVVAVVKEVAGQVLDKLPAGAVPPELHINEAGPDRLDIDGDRLMISLAVRELIQNSQHVFDREGEALRISVEVTLRPLEGQEWVALVYRDNGPGVPKALKQEIFEPYVTTRGAQREKGTRGTGLGLDFVRRVCEGHGGRVVENGPENGGARFTLFLPRAPRGGATAGADGASGKEWR
jgi:signal transduction histidine kinase/GAF domain-containing protein